MAETCAFVSPRGIHCMLSESQHKIRGWHMAWVDRIPNLKMVGDFIPTTSTNLHTGDPHE